MRSRAGRRGAPRDSPAGRWPSTTAWSSRWLPWSRWWWARRPPCPGRACRRRRRRPTIGSSAAVGSGTDETNGSGGGGMRNWRRPYRASSANTGAETWRGVGAGRRLVDDHDDRQLRVLGGHEAGEGGDVVVVAGGVPVGAVVLRLAGGARLAGHRVAVDGGLRGRCRRRRRRPSCRARRRRSSPRRPARGPAAAVSWRRPAASIGAEHELGLDVHAVVGDHVVRGEHLHRRHGDALADRDRADRRARPVVDVEQQAAATRSGSRARCARRSRSAGGTRRPARARAGGPA